MHGGNLASLSHESGLRCVSINSHRSRVFFFLPVDCLSRFTFSPKQHHSTHRTSGGSLQFLSDLRVHHTPDAYIVLYILYSTVNRYSPLQTYIYALLMLFYILFSRF